MPPWREDDREQDAGSGSTSPINTLGPSPLKPWLMPPPDGDVPADQEALDAAGRAEERRLAAAANPPGSAVAAMLIEQNRAASEKMKQEVRERPHDAATAAADEGSIVLTPQLQQRLAPRRRKPRRWRPLFRRIGRFLTGREIDTRLMTEAERTRAAHERQAMARRLIDPRPRHLYGRLDWKRRFRELERRLTGPFLTGREIDTRLLTDKERAAATRELWRQLSAADREAMRVQLARDKEAVRLESWRFRPVRKLKPD
jgi:hypothetical protein